MTMVQISGDEIGGVMRDALRRSLGAGIGGLLGSLTVMLYRTNPPYPSVLVALCSCIVMYASSAYATLSGRKRTPTLAQQVFIKILFVGREDGFDQVIAIILGVFCGVVTMALLSAIILPRSSTYKAMVYMKLSLQKLKELCHITMDKLNTDSSNDNCYSWGEGEINPDFETVLCELYNHLQKCMASLKNAKSEACLVQRRTKHGPGWLVFPGTHWFGENCCCAGKLPCSKFEELQSQIKIVARHYWAVYQSICDMRDSHTEQVITQRYPQSVLKRISQQCVAVMDDIYKAFPSENQVSQKNFGALEVSVELLLNISNRWRTRSVIKSQRPHHLQDLPNRPRTRSRNSLQLTLNPNANSNAVIPPLTRIVEDQTRASRALMIARRDTRSMEMRSAPTLITRPHCETCPTTPMLAVPTHSQINNLADEVMFRSQPLQFQGFFSRLSSAWRKSTREPSRRILNKGYVPLPDGHSQAGSTTLSNLSEDLTISPFSLVRSHERPSQTGDGSKHSSNTDSNNYNNNNIAINIHSEQRRSAEESTLGSAENIRIIVTTDTRRERRNSHGHVLQHSRSRSQPDKKDKSECQDSVLNYEQELYNRYESIDVNSMIVDVPLVEEKNVITFPDTDKGQTQEMKWYAFQFQLDEMLDSQLDLILTENDLLEEIPKLVLTQDVINIYHR
eukprot:TRINITY_DN7735_c0_g1_i10.p1 TRINITY_DN7735_c0_g1~~TRINITY_DN7735_c0_g1_i10.p1  ORF type:complete len:677 (+),score=63.49 TRINITY_DN7735_c0_g1_i10:2452-4482(+)